jgi:hypothetical protein
MLTAILVLYFYLEESPEYLLKKDRIEEFERVILKINRINLGMKSKEFLIDYDFKTQ